MTQQDFSYVTQLKTILKQKSFDKKKATKISSYVSQLYRDGFNKEEQLYNDIIIDLILSASSSWQKEIVINLAKSTYIPNSLKKEFLFSERCKSISEAFIENTNTLSEEWQIAVIDEKSSPEHIALSKRSDLTPTVTIQLLGLNQPCVTKALFENEYAYIPISTLADYIQESRGFPSLLTQILKKEILENEKLIQLFKPWLIPLMGPLLANTIMVPNKLCEKKLVLALQCKDKKNEANLTQATLLRALYMKNYLKFENTLSTILQITPQKICEHVYSESGEWLMVLCKSFGFSKTMFFSLLRLCLKKEGHSEESIFIKLQNLSITYNNYDQELAITTILNWIDNKNTSNELNLQIEALEAYAEAS